MKGEARIRLGRAERDVALHEGIGGFTAQRQSLFIT